MKTAKTFKIVIVFILLSIIHSCSVVDRLTKFNLHYSETITIPPTTFFGIPISLNTPEVETDSESAFEINDTRKDLVEEIILADLTLTVNSPDDGDFGFLKSISIYLNADGLDEVKVAWYDDVPDNAGSVLELETSDSDLKEYIKKNSFSLRLNTLTDESIPSEYEIKMDANFRVDAKILGQ